MTVVLNVKILVTPAYPLKRAQAVKTDSIMVTIFLICTVTVGTNALATAYRARRLTIVPNVMMVNTGTCAKRTAKLVA